MLPLLLCSICAAADRDWLCIDDVRIPVRKTQTTLPNGTCRLTNATTLEPTKTPASADFSDFDADNGLFFVAEKGVNCIRVYDHQGTKISEFCGAPSGAYDFGTIRAISADNNRMLISHEDDANPIISLLTTSPSAYVEAVPGQDGCLLYGNVRIGYSGELYAHGSVNYIAKGWNGYVSDDKVFGLSAVNLSVVASVRSRNHCLYNTDGRRSVEPYTVFDFDKDGTLYYSYKSVPVVYIAGPTQRRSFLIHRGQGTVDSVTVEKLRVDPSGAYVVCGSYIRSSEEPDLLYSVYRDDGRLVSDIREPRPSRRATEDIASIAFDKADGKAYVLTFSQKRKGSQVLHSYKVYALEIRESASADSRLGQSR
jgi:hypothetical protein